jgi:hypothetical protein
MTTPRWHDLLGILLCDDHRVVVVAVYMYIIIVVVVLLQLPWPPSHSSGLVGRPRPRRFAAGRFVWAPPRRVRVSSKNGVEPFLVHPSIQTAKSLALTRGGLGVRQLCLC